MGAGQGGLSGTELGLGGGRNQASLPLEGWPLI